MAKKGGGGPGTVQLKGGGGPGTVQLKSGGKAKKAKPCKKG